MKKSIIALIVVIILSLVVYFICNTYSSFELFEEEPKALQTIDDTGKDYSIKVYYMPANATTQSNIQVRKVLNGKENILESFERYNFLENARISNDTLIVRVNDTSRSHVKAKNFYVKLPN